MYQTIGAEVYRTDLNGTVLVRAKADGSYTYTLIQNFLQMPQGLVLIAQAKMQHRQCNGGNRRSPVSGRVQLCEHTAGALAVSRPGEDVAEGGMARRLTAHPGLELFARFSPDGRWIAFTGQYDGDEQVYVVRPSGLSLERITEGGKINNRLHGWTPDGKHVLFAAHRTPWSPRISRPTLVPAAGESLSLARFQG